MMSLLQLAVDTFVASEYSFTRLSSTKKSGLVHLLNRMLFRSRSGATVTYSFYTWLFIPQDEFCTYAKDCCFDFEDICITKDTTSSCDEVSCGDISSSGNCYCDSYCKVVGTHTWFSLWGHFR